MEFVAVFSHSLLIAKLFSILNLGGMLTSADEDQSENSSSSYGIDWVLFPDDSGSLHFANLSFIPSSVSMLQRNVYFHLYTEQNKKEFEELFIKSDRDSQYFQPESPIKFITHGWMSSGYSSTVIDIKDAYLATQNVNAIIVDWHEIADELVYVIASTSTRYVGYKVAQMAESLVDMYNVSGDQMHLIGHSLGAHVMGYAGKHLQKNNVTAARITGLDPAKPLFEFPLTGGLSLSDAAFVDIIHTCAGVLGYKRSHGHADFYPNDGTAPQPGCDGFAQLVEACSHGRSHQYFTESIESSDFVAYPCPSYDEYTAGLCRNDSTLMGDMVGVFSRGDYYLRTNTEPRYARGDDIVEDEE